MKLVNEKKENVSHKIIIIFRLNLQIVKKEGKQS